MPNYTTKRYTERKAREFGRRLRDLREAREISQRQLAKGTSITAAYISRIETGARYPSVEVMRELAPRLGVSVEYLETGRDAILARTDAETVNSAAERFGVPLRWEELQPDEREQVTQGLDEALLDTLVARIHAVSVNRDLVTA